MEHKYEALFVPTISRGSSICSLGRIISELPDEYRERFAAQVATPGRAGGPSDLDLMGRLANAGFKVGTTTINRHRNNACSCATEGNR